MQECQGFVIGELVKILVIRTDAGEGARYCETDDVVGLGPHLLEHVGRCDRHGEHNSCGTLTPQRAQCRLRGGPGRESIVDHDRGVAGRADAPPSTEPEPATALDLVELSAADPLEVSAVAVTPLITGGGGGLLVKMKFSEVVEAPPPVAEATS